MKRINELKKKLSFLIKKCCCKQYKRPREMLNKPSSVAQAQPNYIKSHLLTTQSSLNNWKYCLILQK